MGKWGQLGFCLYRATVGLYIHGNGQVERRKLMQKGEQNCWRDVAEESGRDRINGQGHSWLVRGVQVVHHEHRQEGRVYGANAGEQVAVA